GQCVGGTVVQLDRRKSEIRDADGVREKFGAGRASTPEFLALVGATADGFPGIKGWGAKSTATVLAHYEHLEAIPELAKDWSVEVRRAAKLATAMHARSTD